MTDKKHDTNTLVRVGMTAGVIGAAAGAITVSMSDKKNRQKVATQLDKMKEWGDKTVNDMKKDAKTVTSEVSKKTEELTSDIDDKAQDLKKDIKEVKEDVEK